MGLRVKEDGKSEGPVIGWIGIEGLSDIIPRESGQTSIRSFVTREFTNRLRRESR